MVQCLHELPPCFSPMFVFCSGDLVVHLLQGGRGGISGSEVIASFLISFSHLLSHLILSNISGSVLIRCRPEGICCDAAFRMMVRKIFSAFWQFVGSRLLLSLSSISLWYRSQFSFFGLKLVRWGIGLIVKSICKLMKIGTWFTQKINFKNL